MKCSATKILSSSVMDCHPQPTGSFIGSGGKEVVLPLHSGAVDMFYSSSQQGGG